MGNVSEWTHQVSEIGEAGLDVKREATAEERQALATQLDILGCNRLVARYRILAAPDGRFKVEGMLEAELVQACVVTLDPVTQRMSEPIRIEFRPKTQIEPEEESEHQVFVPDDPEPIENNRLGIGRVICEIAASALDPYPRAADAALEPGEGKAAPADSKANPFAALANWKPKDQ